MFVCLHSGRSKKSGKGEVNSEEETRGVRVQLEKVLVEW